MPDNRFIEASQPCTTVRHDHPTWRGSVDVWKRTKQNLDCMSLIVMLKGGAGLFSLGRVSMLWDPARHNCSNLLCS